MWRSIHFIIFVLTGFQLAAQLKTLPIESYRNNSTAQQVQQSFDTTLLLPFWDDFSSTGPILDSTKWSLGNSIAVNNTFTVNTPSAYVVTFDGVDGNGNPYNQNSTFNGAGDSLVSQSINLSAVPSSRRSTVYLSFYYQLMGLGEIPDPNDSLQLSFYGADSTWTIIDLTPDDTESYALTGGIDNLVLNEDSALYFRQIIVPVDRTIFFHSSFKFKFVSYSSLSGIYDTWNIDYIYLNRDRDPNETEHRDRAISGQPSPLFYPFNAVPASQYSAFPESYDTPQTITLSNLEDDVFNIEYNHTITNLSNGARLTSGPRNDEGEIGFREVEFGRVVEGISPQNLPIDTDSTVIESEFYYSTGDTLLFEVVDIEGNPLFLPVNLKVNDTLRKRYTITDYFAYDDGSAEFAAGINLLGGKLAVKYWVNTSDTLTGLKVYFPSINPSSVGETVDFIIWSSLEPEVIQRRQSYTIASTGVNQLAKIDLSTPLILNDTFYIGYEQFTDNYIGVGFDKNNKAGSDKIYSNTQREWIRNNRIEGSLMIRPVFESGSDYVLALNENTPSTVKIYPNPSTGEIRIEGDFQFFDIFGISGKKMGRYPGDLISYDLSSLEEGIYLLNFYHKNGITRKKLIKQ